MPIAIKRRKGHPAEPEEKPMTSLALDCPHCRLTFQVDRMLCPHCGRQLSLDILGRDPFEGGHPGPEVLGCPCCKNSIQRWRLSCPHCGEPVSATDRKKAFRPKGMGMGLGLEQIRTGSATDPDEGDD